jgi:hypothetical protein
MNTKKVKDGFNAGMTAVGNFTKRKGVRQAALVGAGVAAVGTAYHVLGSNEDDSFQFPTAAPSASATVAPSDTSGVGGFGGDLGEAGSAGQGGFEDVEIDAGELDVDESIPDATAPAPAPVPTTSAPAPVPTTSAPAPVPTTAPTSTQPAPVPPPVPTPPAPVPAPAPTQPAPTVTAPVLATAPITIENDTITFYGRNHLASLSDEQCNPYTNKVAGDSLREIRKTLLTPEYSNKTLVIEAADATDAFNTLKMYSQLGLNNKVILVQKGAAQDGACHKSLTSIVDEYTAESGDKVLVKGRLNSIEMQLGLYTSASLEPAPRTFERATAPIELDNEGIVSLYIDSHGALVDADGKQYDDKLAGDSLRAIRTELLKPENKGKTIVIEAYRLANDKGGKVGEDYTRGMNAEQIACQLGIPQNVVVIARGPSDAGRLATLAVQDGFEKQEGDVVVYKGRCSVARSDRTVAPRTVAPRLVTPGSIDDCTDDNPDYPYCDDGETTEHVEDCARDNPDYPYCDDGETSSIGAGLTPDQSSAIRDMVSKLGKAALALYEDAAPHVKTFAYKVYVEESLQRLETAVRRYAGDRDNDGTLTRLRREIVTIENKAQHPNTYPDYVRRAARIPIAGPEVTGCPVSAHHCDTANGRVQVIYSKSALDLDVEMIGGLIQSARSDLISVRAEAGELRDFVATHDLSGLTSLSGATYGSAVSTMDARVNDAQVTASSLSVMLQQRTVPYGAVFKSASAADTLLEGILRQNAVSMQSAGASYDQIATALGVDSSTAKQYSGS